MSAHTYEDCSFRLECLKLAHDPNATTAENVSAAEKYAAFVLAKEDGDAVSARPAGMLKDHNGPALVE